MPETICKWVGKGTNQCQSADVKTCSSQQKEEKAPALAVATPVSKEATIVQQMEITAAMAVAKGRRFANKSSASLWLDLLPMLLVSNA